MLLQVSIQRSVIAVADSILMYHFSRHLIFTQTVEKLLKWLLLGTQLMKIKLLETDNQFDALATEVKREMDYFLILTALVTNCADVLHVIFDWHDLWTLATSINSFIVLSF